METNNLHNESTELDGTAQQNPETSHVENAGQEQASEKKGFSMSSAAAGAGFGILLGSVSTFLSACSIEASAAETDGDSASNVGSSYSSSTGEAAWSDGEVGVASSVNDDMSFSEAFAAARGEVGPGGAFEWHGNIYGTYTAEEWDAMTPEERQEYQNHFVWSSSEAETVDTAETADVLDAEPVGMNHTTDDVVTAETVGTDDIIDTSEVEVIGVVHDTESGADFGIVNIDGHDVILADVDSDGEFDIMAADVNGDGRISSDEMVSVENAHIQVSELASNGVGTDDMYAMNDGTPDYVNDADVSGYDDIA